LEAGAEEEPQRSAARRWADEGRAVSAPGLAKAWEWVPEAQAAQQMAQLDR
jgi:hypothetical protein